MSDVTSALAQFAQDWDARLNQSGRATFQYGEMQGEIAAPYVVANRFVQMLGYQIIGHNWEMLDCYGAMGEPRAALTNVVAAMQSDLTQPSKEWLGPEPAKACAQQFCDAFDRSTRTIVSNRYDGLWHPIAGNPVEWAFVGYDDCQIALLLLQPDD